MLIVGSVVWDEEAQVCIVQYSGNSNKASSATRHNGNILPGILALLSFAVLMIVEIGHGFSQWLDTCGWSILSSTHGNINRLGAVEATLDVIVNLWSSLTQVGPVVGTIAEAVLVGTLCAPDYASRGSGGIETSMWTMAFMGTAELAMDLRGKLAAQRSQQGRRSKGRREVGGGRGKLRDFWKRYLSLGPLLTENLRSEKLILALS